MMIHLPSLRGFRREFIHSCFEVTNGKKASLTIQRLSYSSSKSTASDSFDHYKTPIRISSIKKSKNSFLNSSKQGSIVSNVSPPSLDPSNINISQFNEVVKYMKKSSTPRKLITFLEECQQCRSLTWEMTVIAAKNLQFMNRSDLIPAAFDLVLKSDSLVSQIRTDLNSTQQAVNLLCRNGNLDLAILIAKEVGVLPLQEEPLQSNVIDSLRSLKPEEEAVISIRNMKFSQILSDLALTTAINSEYQATYYYLQRLHHLGLTLSSPGVGQKILSIYLSQTNFYHIQTVMNLLLQVDGLSSYESLQLLTNYMIRKIDFIKGAVSVETLPKQEYPEVIFMGRSNVGKSSLINLITNRKKLAYTSKTAGKTSEFNYFLAQGVFGREKIPQNFYLIDLPGVGYARRSKDLRDKWRRLMSEYIQHRQHSLKCVFHLIDSRHGILESDYDCFELLSLLPPSIDYIIVFTKIDKASNRNSKVFLNGVSKKVIEKTKDELIRLSEGKREIPILYTSAMDRDGGVDVLSAILQRLPEIS